MRKISKILIIAIFMIGAIILPRTVFAASVNNNTTAEEKVDTQYFDKIREEREAKELEESGYTETDYSFLSKSEKRWLYNFVHIDEKYKVICIIELVLIVFALFLILKADAINTSTKWCMTIAILAIALYIFQGFAEGGIIEVIDVVLKVLGVLLLLISYVYIFKHDNVLIYAPICIIGTYYVASQFTVIQNNPIIILIFIAVPIALYIFGKIALKAKELEMLRPVKEKHERK